MNNTLQLLDKHLAELLGWEGLHTYMGELLGYSKTSSLLEVPRWTADNGACFELMVGQVISFKDNVTHVKLSVRAYEWIIYEDYKNHTSKEEAVRVAIVKAVIAKLEAAHERYIRTGSLE
jgi:hypothetical protein